VDYENVQSTLEAKGWMLKFYSILSTQIVAISRLRKFKVYY